MTEQIIEVDLNKLVPNPWNPHSSTNAELSNITNSIKEIGQIVPIIVVKFDTAVVWEDKEYLEPDKYLIVDGEQRYKALTQLFLDGTNTAFKVRILVIGNTSDYEAWELVEVGQAANHTRGSLEDDLKTGKLMSEVLKHRSLEDFTKIVSQRPDYLAKAATLVGTRAVAMTPTKLPKHNPQRGYYTVTLPFETSQDLKEFEDLILQLPAANKAVKGLERSYKLTKALKNYVKTSNS